MVTVGSSPPSLLHSRASYAAPPLGFSFASVSAHVLPPFPLRRHRSFRCSAGLPDHREASPVLKLVVSGFTELLRFISPEKRDDNGADYAPLARSTDDVLQNLILDYGRAYFLTGNFTSNIYADDCLFEDPTIKFTGKDQYSRNLDLLVPFFECPSLVLQKIEKGCIYGRSSVIAEWKLRTYLKFPWRPLISILGTTTYELDEEFKIVRHAESWNVSPLDAIGQIFTAGSRGVDE